MEKFKYEYYSKTNMVQVSVYKQPDLFKTAPSVVILPECYKKHAGKSVEEVAIEDYAYLVGLKNSNLVWAKKDHKLSVLKERVNFVLFALNNYVPVTKCDLAPHCTNNADYFSSTYNPNEGNIVGDPDYLCEKHRKSKNPGTMLHLLKGDSILFFHAREQPAATKIIVHSAGISLNFNGTKEDLANIVNSLHFR